MRFRTWITSLPLFLLFFCFSTSQSQLTLRRNPSSPKPATALIAALDGTIYLVDSSSGRVIWSFSTGSPIYHSYHAPINNPNPNPNPSNSSSNQHVTGLIECGDDWELILHDTHFGKTKLSQSVADYVAVTPTLSEDGAVILGTKKSTVFEVDAKTGKLVRSYATLDSSNSNASSAAAVWGDGTVLGKKNSSELADPALLNSPKLLLKIIRTDYFLQSVGPGSGIVLWTLKVAEFKAVLLCQPNDEYASEIGLDFAMPYACGDRKLKEVYRQRKSFLFEPASLESLSGSYQENDMLPMPTSDLMLPLLPDVVLPLHSLPPKVGFYDSNDSEALVPLPLLEVTASGEVEPNRVIRLVEALVFILFTVCFIGFLIFYHPLVVKNPVMLKEQNSESKLKTSPKKKRVRKSGRNNSSVDNQEQDKLLSTVEEDILAHKQAGSLAWLHFNMEDGRRIGKLYVTTKEIAPGSDGTVVLEGMYEGRAVAIKRLVKVHHDVAHKEIENLMVSDHHPNIVRWYGVERDNDFVYLALERCACNLNDLINFYSDISENPVFSRNQASELFNNVRIETERDGVQNLWKENGYPSTLLLKLMRDVVSGLAHLHELGIVHRDLKPQNVLIIKERSLCAKLSDMGISKRLVGDMTSLGQSATGCGSPGWQAPEQLGQGRQTRAVDLFSLGCLLFFCMTAGRHPFGVRVERDVNIVRNQKDLFLVEFIPEAEELISSLLNPNPDLRPKAIEVLQHPLFWSSEMRLSFLRDASDRVELEDRETDSDLLKALESIASVAIGAKWDEKLGQAFLTNIGRYRRYKYDSVRDLLRVLRNKLNHYRELPQEIQELIGPVPEGFYNYFASRFPKLLIEVYKVIHQYCKDDECFQRYFGEIH